MSTGARSNARDLILGGVVSDNTEGLAMLDDVNVRVGRLLALIIRGNDDVGQRVTLYQPSLWYGEQADEHAGSCDDIVESVPPNLDGGYFDDIKTGHEIDTG